jgi:hypothetical protein
VPPPRLRKVGFAAVAGPTTHYALGLRGRDGAAHGEESSLGIRRRDAGQRAHLGVGQLAQLERFGESRQPAQRPSDAHPLPRRARIEAHSPGQPIGAGAEAGPPSAAVVEVADESQEPGERSVDLCGEGGDLVAETLDLVGLGKTWKVC